MPEMTGAELSCATGMWMVRLDMPDNSPAWSVAVRPHHEELQHDLHLACTGAAGCSGHVDSSRRSHPSGRPRRRSGRFASGLPRGAVRVALVTRGTRDPRRVGVAERSSLLRFCGRNEPPIPARRNHRAAREKARGAASSRDLVARRRAQPRARRAVRRHGRVPGDTLLASSP